MDSSKTTDTEANDSQLLREHYANFIPQRYTDVLRRINEAKLRRKESQSSEVTVVAVTKTKPKEAVIEAYNLGIRHFGENYVNELVQKASEPEIIEMCPDIKWHMIGHLQSNKVNKLMETPNLHMVQTVHSIKLADILDKAWAKTGKSNPLNIMVQVHTSGEETKSGIPPDEVENLLEHIVEKCPHLNCTGLMLIGYAHHDLSLGPNPEFITLSKCRDSVLERFSFKHLELSMGMSQDFEHAVEMGSTCVRVGSCLFGERAKKSN